MAHSHTPQYTYQKEQTENPTMQHITLPIKILDEKATTQLPQYMSHGASGMDLCACLDESVVLQPHARTLVPTGIAISLPAGFEAQIRPRSGLALKHGITLPNSPGTIDSDYRGEIKLIIANYGTEPFVITHGMRLAQMIVTAYVKAEMVVVDDLDETQRGAGGFGHTGIEVKIQ